MPHDSDWQLNPTHCLVRHIQGKGRGVFGTIIHTIYATFSLKQPSAASCPLLAGTVLEISPVLLFNKDEYSNHGRHTILDHYTFKWRDGRMALALGLGSTVVVSAVMRARWLIGYIYT